MSIHGTSRQDDARARAFWSEDYYCYLTAEGLGRLPEGHTYALWLDSESHGVILAGSFEPDGSGSATMWTPLPRDLGGISRAFVTAETKGDIEEPTGPVELDSLAKT